MTFHLCRAFILSLFLTVPCLASRVDYTVSIPQPQTHYAEIEMVLSGWKGGEMDVRMPVWAPGSYLVREFSRFVEDVKATDEKGNKLTYVRSAKNGFKFQAPGGKVTIRYRVYAYELTVRTSFIDEDHAYLNGTSIFMFVEEATSWPVTVRFNKISTWNTISVALEKTGENTFAAENYDLLVDSPFEIGNHKLLKFESLGVPHEIAIFGDAGYDATRLVKDLKKITEECAAVIGGKHPCERYLFIIHNLSSGGGGLEHTNSTTLQVNRTAYASESGYTGFLSLAAHEYFHLWNVKRLRPVELGPFDYNNENYTTMLWFSEGFTAYYDDLIVRRCGFVTPENYLGTLAGNFSYVTNTSGSKVQSLEESSFDAWIKYYRPTENSANNSVSYYTKGAAIGAVLDLSIRSASAGKKSLDDVLRLLYKQFYTDNKGKSGFTEKDFKAAVNTVAGSNLDDFYVKYIAGTDSVPFGEFLSKAGLLISDLNAKQPSTWIGINTSYKENKLTISAVERNSPAWNAGLNVNDELIAVNNYRFGDDAAKLISAYKPGSPLTFTVSRGGMLRVIPVVAQVSPMVKYSISVDPKSTEDRFLIYKQWLKID